MRWTLGDIARACGGTLTHERAAGAPARGISIDTRTLAAGDVYVALTGENHDGHAFLAAAFARGAVAAIVATGRIKAVNGHPLIQVSNTLEALQALATRSRSLASATVLAVTGSNGKTTTREMIAAILAGEGPTLTPIGNRNNHIGVPLTLLDLEPNHRFAVLELAMNHPGEISHLSRLASPSLALITNVGRAHVGLLGGIEAVRRAKLEIVDGLAPDGTLLVPGDDAVLVRAARATGARVETFGTGEDMSHAVRGIEPVGDGRHRVLVREGLVLTLPIPGVPAALCAVAALAAARALGVAESDAVARLERFAAVAGRVAVHVREGITIIDDAYNANPESMRAALETLAGIRASGRRIAVLGDMLELGDHALAAHREILEGVAGIDVLHLVGETMRLAAEVVSPTIAVTHHADRDALITALAGDVRAGDVVLVKASRGLGLEAVVRALTDGEHS